MSASIPTMVERSIGMESKKHQKIAKNLLIMICVFVAAILVCSVLYNYLDASNPFAVSIFILAVVLIARFTDGYLYGVVASDISVFCVNYMFTYPFWEFNMSISANICRNVAGFADRQYADNANQETGTIAVRDGKREDAGQPFAFGFA